MFSLNVLNSEISMKQSSFEISTAIYILPLFLNTPFIQLEMNHFFITLFQRIDKE